MGVASYQWDWSVIWQYRGAFFKGVIVTFELTTLSIIFGTILGFTLATVISLKNKKLAVIKKFVLVYIDVIRSLPILILILLLNYWGPYILGTLSPFSLSVIALSINLSAFVANDLRGAIEGVPQPLIEAGYAIGMNDQLVLKRIIIPEAIRQIIAPLTSWYISILKLSSLASVIAVNEVTHVAAEVSSKTFRFLETFAALAFIYIIIVLPFSFWARSIERSRWFIRRS